MAEVLGQPLSDGSYWTINLNIAAATPPPTHCCPGLFKMDLCFNRTCLVVYEDDEFGNPSDSQEIGIFHTVVPTLHLPGTMNRAEYYTALHQWLHSQRYRLPLEGDVVNDFTDHVIERVFGTLYNNPKVGIWVHADLRRVSHEYRSSSMEFDELDDESEYIDEEEYVERLGEFYRVVAAEEHRRFGDCSICLEGLVPVVGEEAKSEKKNYLFGSPCGHFFHSECMDKWLWMSCSCPLCRFDLS